MILSPLWPLVLASTFLANRTPCSSLPVRFLELLDAFTQTPLTPESTHAFEQRLGELLRELGRDLCSAAFQAHEPTTPTELPARLTVDGDTYRRRGQTPNTIATRFGSIVLHRFVYEPLEPGLPCLFPLERRLGIVAGAATPALADQASRSLAQLPQRATLDLLNREHDVAWSPKTLRQVTAAVAAGLEDHRQAAQVDVVVSWLEQAEKSRGRHRPVLVAGRDGIHLPMRGRQAYREGATATLTVYDRRGRRLGTVRLGRMPEAGQQTLSKQLTELIEAVLRRWQGSLPRLAYVTDAGSHPATYYHTVLKRQRHPRTGEPLEWVRVVDYYHAATYVQRLAEALFGDTTESRRWAKRMRRRLKEKDGVKRVLQSATMHALAAGLSGRREEDFGAAYRYLRKHRGWMKYDRYRALGVPLGSGVTEAGCKTVFTQRLKQSGMRWDVASGQVVVTLRVVLLSGVWVETMRRELASKEFHWPGVEGPTQAPDGQVAA